MKIGRKMARRTRRYKIKVWANLPGSLRVEAACPLRSRVVHSCTSYRASEDSAVTTPAKTVPATTSRSQEVVAKHKKYLWPSVTNYYQQPLVADRGEMQYLWDLEGRKYLDFFGGILTVSVGECNPAVTS